ncbi:MAG: superoxide dismutase [Hyphomicrobiaceae bacterium]|nr:superoxide dismutase [Hyphomicrobiaceae bacterium]
MSFSLPNLPYAYDALHPYMSRETLEFHHDKHHNAYVVTGNNLLEGSDYASLSLTEIVKKAYKDKNHSLINQAGQHYNHIHFWNWMKPNGGGKSIPNKIELLFKAYGGFEKVRKDFINAGVTQFGSGWAWLSVRNGKLEVVKTPNGENPLMYDTQPILGCDVWEHSYYIDYRNARPKYMEAFFDNLINWDYVEAMYEQAD